VFADSYSPEFEDFAADGWNLDKWVFDRVETFFSTATADAQLMKRLHSEKTVFFLHLLGSNPSLFLFFNLPDFSFVLRQETLLKLLC
jgi:hypothetical protein